MAESVIQKNALETVRVERHIFKGREYVSARVFVIGDDGEEVAARKGLTLAPDVARKVAQAMLTVADQVGGGQ